MPKTTPFRKISIDEAICKALEQRKIEESRHGSLTAFIQEILDLYSKGVLIDARLEISQSELPKGLVKGIRVRKISATHGERKAG